MPTYDELDLTGMKIDGFGWSGPTLRANYGGGYGDAALVGAASGLHQWTLKRATLPGSGLLAPIDAKSRFDYYWDFFKEHTTGDIEIFIVEFRGKKYHASFADPKMDISVAVYGLFSPEIYRSSGVKINQRRVVGLTYNDDGSIDIATPDVPTGFEVVGTTSTTVTLDWDAGPEDVQYGGVGVVYGGVEVVYTA